MKNRLFVDLSLLRDNPDFRRLLIARTISLMGLGILAVSVPIQIQQLTGSSLQVGLAAALDAAGMFVGLLLGGVLADLYDRRRLILFARSTCGLGFVALAANSLLPSPSLWAIYALTLWDGFFGALGVSALMAAMPVIVGRENLMQAGALGMMTARFATVASPALGGVIIASAGLAWNYGLAAFATLLTVLTLTGLPAMTPGRQEAGHPLRMLGEAFGFLLKRPPVLAIFAIGAVCTLTSSIRILFPALSGAYGGTAFETGLMYSAVPVGATLGAMLSGWARDVQGSPVVMLGLSAVAFFAVVMVGAAGQLPLSLCALIVYGYATAIASLLQYTMIQAQTPDHQLGRVNALWAAQDNLADIVGALLIGAVAQFLMPAQTMLVVGAAALALSIVLALFLRAVRVRPEAMEERARP